MAGVEVLLFDLGGVLVDSAGLRALPQLLPAPLASDELRRRWLQSRAVERFESGQCSGEAFAAAFIEEWGLALAPADFLAQFRSWVTAPYPGVAELLLELRTRYMLACLSNTNALHWEKMLLMDGLLSPLQRHFTSFRLGVMKPSPEIYAHVVGELGCPARAVAFFDDGIENIEAAARAGLSAHLIERPDRLPMVLSDLGLLPPDVRRRPT